MPEGPFLSERHPVSRRLAEFDDDGTSAWLYLSGVDGDRPEADAWVYNRVPAPEPDQLERYRGGPPPAARGYAGAEALCEQPEVSLGRAVVCRRSCGGRAPRRPALAFIPAGARRGHSRLLVRSGPWGEIWSEVAYIHAIGG